MIPPGSIIDNRYEILGTLGVGGMGEVYRAARKMLGDEVAIKIMRGPVEAASEQRHRFLRESRSCAQLRHPNIVSILDFNIDALGQPYMVMELLSGPSLREEIELSGAMPPQTVVEVLTPIAAALQLAHDRGITHRDLKPANIVAHRFETGERVYKVIDFGLASVKEATDQTKLTGPNVFMGTVAYAAPEQMCGEPPDARTDVYALGVIAYEMLTGRLPFDASGSLTLINQALTVTPQSPGKYKSGLSSEVDAAVMRALEKDRARRWPSVIAFVDALRAACSGGPFLSAEALAKAEAPPGSTSQPVPDTLLSRYDLGQMVGRGRLGSVVYLGSHRALGVRVAIRVLRREEQPNWDAVKARFLVEARTLQVSHPNLLQVRDFGETDRLVFVVTDYIEGSSLRQELARDRTMAWPRARNLLRQMLDATAVLNDHGGFIVGVNPDMIRLTGEGDAERIVLSTAGIRSVQDVLATMREQELRGEEASEQELPYIAPEVLMGRAPEPASDVFTAGVLAYKMVTGKLPFRARSLPELIGQMLQTTPEPAGSLNVEVPEKASESFAQCLLADTTSRLASVRDLLARL